MLSVGKVFFNRFVAIFGKKDGSFSTKIDDRKNLSNPFSGIRLKKVPRGGGGKATSGGIFCSFLCKS